MEAAVTVAQLVERPVVGSLEKVELCWREFDSRGRGRGKNIVEKNHINPRHAICGAQPCRLGTSKRAKM